MRPIPARIVLATVIACAIVAGVLTAKAIFFVVALGAGVLLVTTLSTSRLPLTRALGGFRHHAVEVRLWGAPPPDLSGLPLIVDSVNALGAGAHVFFRRSDGTSFHLKIAQPYDQQMTPGRIVVGSAKYVQWNGRKIPRAANAPAVEIGTSHVAR